MRWNKLDIARLTRRFTHIPLHSYLTPAEHEMNWLKRFKHLFKEVPESEDINIDEALALLECVRCGGPLNATLITIDDAQEAWEFHCQDERCESHAQH